MKLYKNLPEITAYYGKKPIRAVVIKDWNPENPNKGLVRIAKIGKNGNLSRKSWLVWKIDYKIRGRADSDSWTAPLIYNEDKTIGVDSESLTKLDSIYCLVNGTDKKSIVNGNSFEESKVKDDQFLNDHIQFIRG